MLYSHCGPQVIRTGGSHNRGRWHLNCPPHLVALRSGFSVDHCLGGGLCVCFCSLTVDRKPLGAGLLPYSLRYLEPGLACRGRSGQRQVNVCVWHVKGWGLGGTGTKANQGTTAAAFCPDPHGQPARGRMALNLSQPPELSLKCHPSQGPALLPLHQELTAL